MRQRLDLPINPPPNQARTHPDVDIVVAVDLWMARFLAVRLVVLWWYWQASRQVLGKQHDDLSVRQGGLPKCERIPMPLFLSADRFIHHLVIEAARSELSS